MNTRNNMKATKIQLEPNLVPLLRSMGMNWAAQAQKPFEFKPTSFTTKVDGLKPRPFSQPKQLEMMESWLKRPLAPGTFGIMSAPTDGKSLLMAAWMMQAAYREGNPTVKWYDLTGGFDCPLLSEPMDNLGVLVLNNVGPDSSQTKKEKLRDLLTVYANVSKIVVVNGSDPYTFFTKELRMPLTGLCYLTNSAIKGIEI
jgi:hypothetical protein